MADTLKTQGMSLLQATRLVAGRQLGPLPLPSPRDAYWYKRKKKAKLGLVGPASVYYDCVK